MGIIAAVIFLASILSYPIIKKLGRKGFLFGSASLTVASVALLPTALRVANEGSVKESNSWISEIGINLDFYADPLRLSFAYLTLIAGLLILFYSAWYFNEEDKSMPRFSGLFLAFAASMFGLILADNLYLFFVFWEATTVLSFLLIGHQHQIRASRSAAIQALVVTTFGGLAMLVGMVLIHVATAEVRISNLLLLEFTQTPLITVAVLLLLLGAFTKSAIFPFHFWLPDAMAAPTPVSAYLHAAAMVKAGILLVIYLTPTVANLNFYTPLLVVLGGITMIWGGYRSLKQYDLKLLVAHSTVSQLGMLVMLLAIPNEMIRHAAILLTFAHAAAKAPLFLTVGVIDHRYGTRDIRELSNLGKRNPTLLVTGVLAAASLAGVLPLVGFVGKEAALAALYSAMQHSALYTITLVIFILGSVLTVAYMTRFVIGSFAKKIGVSDSEALRKKSSFLLFAPVIFSALLFAGGIFSPLLKPWIVGMTAPAEEIIQLALWHGITKEFLTTVLILTIGILLGIFSLKTSRLKAQRFEKISFSHAYWQMTHIFDLVAVRVTALAQRGSLPWYIGIILLTVTLSQVFVGSVFELPKLTIFQNPVEIPLAILIIVASIRVVFSKTRFKSVILVGVTGYALVAIFMVFGAPDLAITQALVETMTLITFILVIRKLPIKIATTGGLVSKVPRIIISVSATAVIGILTALAINSRQTPKVSEIFDELAYKIGNGLNIVNVTLVDIRAWDTMGELSVVVAAATGVASLIFLVSRSDNLPRLSRKDAKTRVRKQLLRVVDPEDETRSGEWILAGNTLDPSKRSIILEVVVRLVFHALMILSIYLLLVGHNMPGGGFAGGLVAGLALAARYLAGGRHELGATTGLDAGKLLGGGLLLATGTALIPLLFKTNALTSAWFDINLGFFGEIKFGTTTIFDIGVYLVVVGLALDVLRSLGAQIDENEENRVEEQTGVSAK